MFLARGGRESAGEEEEEEEVEDRPELAEDEEDVLKFRLGDGGLEVEIEEELEVGRRLEEMEMLLLEMLTALLMLPLELANARLLLIVRFTEEEQLMIVLKRVMVLLRRFLGLENSSR